MSDDPPYALLSVADKTDIAPWAGALTELGYRLVATEGTRKHLEEAGLDVRPVSEITGSPELLDGRVKTLHPAIHAGVLARAGHEKDRRERLERGIPRFELVAIRFYPLERAVCGSETSEEISTDAIDIGGPALVRAAAKNAESTWVATSLDDYEPILEAIRSDDDHAELRRRLACKAFRRTARYDATIASHLGRADETSELNDLPETWATGYERLDELRYGENSHQKGALYRADLDRPRGGFNKLHGANASFNNLVDLDAAVQLTLEFDHPASAIVKHTSPAGCGRGDDVEMAYERALDCDPMSAFGGIVALNRPVEASLAEKLNETYLEVIAAPSYTDEALDVLKQRERVQIIEMPKSIEQPRRHVRETVLGAVAQTADPPVELDRDDVEIPTEREPTDREWAALAFNWRVCKHVRSNAIVLGGPQATFGVGAGQMSRVDAVEIAVDKSRQSLTGAVMASDAFFPFRDGLDAAAEAGVTAVIQPGGSRNDNEVVEACDEYGVAMILTDERHFRH